MKTIQFCEQQMENDIDKLMKKLKNNQARIDQIRNMGTKPDNKEEEIHIESSDNQI